MLSFFSAYCIGFGKSDYPPFESTSEVQSSYADSLREIVPEGIVLQELNCDIDANGSTDAILLYEDGNSKTCLAVMLHDSFCEGISLASGCGYTYSSEAELKCLGDKFLVSVELNNPENGETYQYSIEISYNHHERMIEYRIMN